MLDMMLPHLWRRNSRRITQLGIGELMFISKLCGVLNSFGDRKVLNGNLIFVWLVEISCLLRDLSKLDRQVYVCWTWSSSFFFTDQEGSCPTYILVLLTKTNPLRKQKFLLTVQKVSFHSILQALPENSTHNITSR